MNPRIPYNPDRKPRGRPFWALMAVPLLAAAAVMLFRSRAASPAATVDPNSTPGLTLIPPTATLEAPQATPAPSDVLLPPGTPTRLITPSPTPTALLAPQPTVFYTTLSGDTLPAVASRFGVNPSDIQAPVALRGRTTLQEGQLLVIPSVLDGVGPAARLIPDSELVYSGGGAGFDPEVFAEEQAGYLARYKGFADARTRAGGDIVLLVAQHHSINPRLLVALLEYQGGWLTNPNPSQSALDYPLGYRHPYRHNLYAQLNWAAVVLADGYYGWRAGTLTEVHFPDGATVRLDPALNAGTVAVQNFFAQVLDRPAWEQAVGPNGFIATYQAFFGDPFARALDPLIPADLVQPALSLPFRPGQVWGFTAGPHGAWIRGGAQAALDFAPGSFGVGCGVAEDWVTAAAAGLIVRVEHGSVLLDLDGDGREATGWVILYLHIAERDRVKEGTFVEKGDRIGHPSCEGGSSTGTHVHIARKYNGEWILADGVIPFNLSGWVAARGDAEYLGTLTRGDQVVTACTCTASWTAIVNDK